MRNIYKSCYRTIIWLGVDGWLTKSAIDGIEFLGSISDDADHPSEVRYYKWPQLRRERRGLNGGPSLLESIRTSWGELHAQAAFAALFSRPWFTRLWVVQELALSRRAVFVCGRYDMDWAVIEKAQLVASAFFPGHGLIMPILLQKWSDDHGPYDIGTHMLATWEKDATVAKDRIYGLMGLPSTDDKDVTIDVDYKKSDDEIFTTFTATYLKQTGNLRIFAISRGCKNYEQMTGNLPSWVVDHRDYGKHPEPWAWFGCRSYQAGGPGRCKPIVEGEELGLQGFSFDIVNRVSVINTNGRNGSFVRNVITSFENAIAFSRYLLDCRRIYREYDNDEATRQPTTTRPKGYYSHRTNETIPEAFWTTVRMSTTVVDVGSPRESPRQRKIRKTVEGMLNWHSGIIAAVGYWPGSLILAILYLVVLLRTAVGGDFQYVEYFSWSGGTKERRFFITEKGYFGLGPSETKPGDEIVVVQGSRAVLIARPGKPRRIVGESFVHGIMSGEVFDQGRCETLWFG